MASDAFSGICPEYKTHITYYNFATITEAVVCEEGIVTATNRAVHSSPHIGAHIYLVVLETSEGHVYVGPINV